MLTYPFSIIERISTPSILECLLGIKARWIINPENETMLVRAEIEGDMSVPCSGKGCPKSPKSDDETTGDIEARTDAGETTEEEIVSIKSCKGRKCKEQNTTSIEEDSEEEKPCKGKKCDELDAEVRAEDAAADTAVIAEVKVKKCKGKKCEEDGQEIANLAEAGVAEAAAMATEEPSKISKVSKMSSDETEVSTIVCGSHHLLLFFNKRFPFSLFAYFLLTQQKSLPIVPQLFSTTGCYRSYCCRC